MSNKAFIAIIVMILVVFALIYVITPSTKEDGSNTSSISTQEKRTKQLLNFDLYEVTSSPKQKIGISSEKEKQTIKVEAPNIKEEKTTKKKKVVIIGAETPKTTKPSKTIRISADEAISTTSSEANGVKIRVNWENENRKEKGSYIMTVDSETVLTVKLITKSIEDEGYVLTSVQTGQEHIGKKAVEKEYNFDIRVSKNSEN